MNLRYPRARRRFADLINSCCFPIWLLVLILGFQTPDDSPQDEFLGWVRLALLIAWMPGVFYAFGINIRHSWRKRMRRS